VYISAYFLKWTGGTTHDGDISAAVGEGARDCAAEAAAAARDQCNFTVHAKKSEDAHATRRLRAGGKRWNIFELLVILA
jgi:hypothetical protein